MKILSTLENSLWITRSSVELVKSFFVYSVKEAFVQPKVDFIRVKWKINIFFFTFFQKWLSRRYDWAVMWVWKSNWFCPQTWTDHWFYFLDCFIIVFDVDSKNLAAGSVVVEFSWIIQRSLLARYVGGSPPPSI